MFDASDGGPAVAEMAGITGGSFVLDGVTWHHENDVVKLRLGLADWAQKVGVALGNKPGRLSSLTPDQAVEKIRKLKDDRLPALGSVEALRFAADVLQELGDRHGSYNVVAPHIRSMRVEADRLEREQAAKTARDHAIEQAAQVAYLANNTHDTDVGWDTVHESTREGYRRTCRALFEAGLLKAGEQ